MKALSEDPVPSGASTDTGANCPGLGTFAARKLKLSVHCAHAPEEPSVPSASAAPPRIALLRGVSPRVVEPIGCLRHPRQTQCRTQLVLNAPFTRRLRGREAPPMI